MSKVTDNNNGSKKVIHCFICMRKFEQTIRLDEIGVKMFFCKKHYPKEWDDRT